MSRWESGVCCETYAGFFVAEATRRRWRILQAGFFFDKLEKPGDKSLQIKYYKV